MDERESGISVVIGLHHTDYCRLVRLISASPFLSGSLLSCHISALSSPFLFYLAKLMNEAILTFSSLSCEADTLTTPFSSALAPLTSTNLMLCRNRDKCWGSLRCERDLYIGLA